MMKRKGGFTLIELLVVVTIIGILVAIALPQYMKAKDKAKEAEAQSNLHSIQISLERYAVDHSGKYPKYLLGGDLKNQTKGTFATGKGINELAADPLIACGYINSYPRNPFTEGTESLQWTGNAGRKGTGDLRFGWNGDTMGNGLGDPKYFWNSYDNKSGLWITGYWQGTIDANYLRWYWGGKAIPDRKADSPFIMYTDDPSNGSMIVSWPGNFFYRSYGDMLPLYKTLIIDETDIWNSVFKFNRITHYMLGVYGSNRSKGKDVIRITNIDGHILFNKKGYSNEGNYNGGYYNSNYNFKVHFSAPEVFGGGQFKNAMPLFPPYDEYGNLIFGAPDGYKDGIILILKN